MSESATGLAGNRPSVSVIVPVYNDPDGIKRCLEALEKQTYPDDHFEVLVVDNGSTDDTRTVIQEYSVTLLVEDDVQGSYAARNTGIEHANGEILAFTDADCTPSPEWIEAGVVALEQENADLASGRVKFEFTAEKTAAERFDASVNMRNDESVQDGVAKTANVFVRKCVVNKIGPFPDHLISGGDVYWSKSATKTGFELVYAPEAVVRHPSRRLYELVRKQYRVGTGQIQIWRLDDRSAVMILLVGLIRFPLKAVRFLFGYNKTDRDSHEIPADRRVEKGIGVYAVAVLCMLSMTFGRIVRAIQG